jgi:cyclic pyranopterin phosphate synthase
VPDGHFDAEGQAWMVDVSGKPPTLRTAEAAASVQLGAALLARVAAGEVAKGDVLGVARLAGIAAVKRTPELIPLAHPLAVHHAAIAFDQEPQQGRIRIICRVRAHERTGVEMEAMVGATVAALTIYDMCKGADKSITIGPAYLVSKAGGKSGSYRREDPA